MSEPLLKTLMDDPSGGQIAGGIMMILLFSSVGAIAASAMAYATRRIFLGKLEQYFWAVLLGAIAAFYIGFAGWFQASTGAWATELSAIAVFVVIAVIGGFSGLALAIGYFMHGAWDIAHSLFGTVILGNSASDIPLGYGMFCLGFDIAAAVYLLWWPKQWDNPSEFKPTFWRSAS